MRMYGDKIWEVEIETLRNNKYYKNTPHIYTRSHMYTVWCVSSCSFQGNSQRQRIRESQRIHGETEGAWILNYNHFHINKKLKWISGYFPC